MAPSEATHYQSDNWDLHISRAYGNLVLEGFTKDGETLKHLVWQVESTDLVTALDLVLRYGRVVKRPYLLGQGCDGSIGVPVMALYLDFCTRHDLNAQTLYDLAYPGEKKLEPEATTAFAKWQGIRLPYTWTEACLEGLLKSLSQINEHILESVLEEAARGVTFPRGVLKRGGYVAFRGTTRCYGPDARFTWGYVVTPTGEKVWQYDPWQSKNGVVPQHYWLSFIAVAARHDGNLELARQVVAEAERSARSPANRAHYRNWLATLREA